MRDGNARLVHEIIAREAPLNQRRLRREKLLQPREEMSVPVTKKALVVGGGIAGMAAALSLARQGYPVHLVEKSDRLGGNAQRLLKTAEGEDVRTELNSIIDRVAAGDLDEHAVGHRLAGQ